MIETYCPAVHDEMVKIGVNSKGGRGGMTAKMQAAWMAAQQGVTTIIANGKASDSLLQVRSSVIPMWQTPVAGPLKKEGGDYLTLLM